MEEINSGNSLAVKYPFKSSCISTVALWRQDESSALPWQHSQVYFPPTNCTGFNLGILLQLTWGRRWWRRSGRILLFLACLLFGLNFSYIFRSAFWWHLKVLQCRNLSIQMSHVWTCSPGWIVDQLMTSQRRLGLNHLLAFPILEPLFNRFFLGAG